MSASVGKTLFLDIREKSMKKGPELRMKFVYHIWLVLIGLVILAANTPKHGQHHHYAGIGAMFLIACYFGAIGFATLVWAARRGPLFDRSDKAGKRWNWLVWGCVPGLAIFAWLTSAPAGSGIAIASLGYLAIMVLETLVARADRRPKNNDT